MKVKNINASSLKTEDAIKNSFIELLNEKKELNLITVTELVNLAGITRSSFYTHYDNIYDVAKAIQDDTLSLFPLDEAEFKSIQDVNNYIDEIINYLKDNEETYKMLLSSNDTLLFFDKIRKQFVDKISILLVENGFNSKHLELDVEFFLDGMFYQLVKYFRKQDNHSLNEIGNRIKIWLEKLFFN